MLFTEISDVYFIFGAKLGHVFKYLNCCGLPVFAESRRRGGLVLLYEILYFQVVCALPRFVDQAVSLFFSYIIA